MNARFGHDSAKVIVVLSDPTLAEKFLGYLRAADCVADLGEGEAQAESIAVNVEVPAAYDDDQARLEVGLYLRIWEAVNPGSGAELLD